MKAPAGVHTSWWTLGQQLSTHQLVTVVLPTGNGKILKIRKGTTPEPVHKQIYATLRMPAGSRNTCINVWADDRFHLERRFQELPNKEQIC